MFDILIIGSGPAGLTAGIYASRANKKVGIVEGSAPCGQLMRTTHIENYPGFDQPILGPELMQNMYNQTKNLNVEMISGTLIDFEKWENIFTVFLNKQKLKSKTLIIATGASPCMLGIEKQFLGKGVSTCATCDGNFFKNQDIAIIGGGNTAFEEALYLSNLVNKLYIIHRRNDFRAEQILQDRLKAKKNIEFCTPYIAQKFIGENTLKQIIIENQENQTQKTLNVSGCFIAIGHKPNTDFLQEKIELTKTGYAKAQIITEMDGLFVAGDVHDNKYRQAITAAGFGCMAAIEAIKYLELNV